MLGNEQCSYELLVDGKPSQKLQLRVEALNQQCIWARFSKAMPKNEQKRCRDILTSTRGGNPEKAHSNSSEKVQKIHKIFQKHL